MKPLKDHATRAWIHEQPSEYIDLARLYTLASLIVAAGYLLWSSL